MGDAAAILAPVVTGATLGLVQPSLDARKQKKEMQKETERQRDEQRRREAELEDNKRRDLLSQAQLARHRSAVGMGAGNNIRPGGTLLTSPIGVVGSPATGQKSLLGQ